MADNRVKPTEAGGVPRTLKDTTTINNRKGRQRNLTEMWIYRQKDNGRTDPGGSASSSQGYIGENQSKM